MRAAPPIVLAGVLLASAGCVGWALEIGVADYAWPFWAFAAGTLVAGAGSFLRGAPYVTPLGWTIAGAGAARLLIDQMSYGVGSDGLAPHLFYAGFLVASAASWVALAKPTARPVAIGGIALVALGGLWWTALDVFVAASSLLWANACLGVGYALVAAGSSARPEGRALHAAAGAG